MENVAVKQAAERVVGDIRQSLDDLISSGSRGAVVGSAPAGAGKTHFVCDTVEWLLERVDGAVMVLTPTNKQSEELIERLVARRVHVTRLHSRARGRLMASDYLEQVTTWDEVEELGDTRVVVATVNKMGDVVQREERETDYRFADVLILDEAFQVKSSDYLCVAAAADFHLMVGDPGQLDPFTTLGNVDWWQSLVENPLATAVDVITRNHPHTPVHKFPITRRLDERGASLARAFYPGHEFAALTPAGVRSMRGTVPIGRRGVAPGALRTADDCGFAYVTLPAVRVQKRDTELAAVIGDIVLGLLNRNTELTDERGTRTLVQEDVVVGVSYNEQRLLVERALVERDLDRVNVLTANKAQGLQFEVTVVWHPLAGADEVDPFRLDTGRLCVLMTRHRQACIVVGREGDRELLDGIPPSTSAYPGEADRVLNGWYSHRDLLERLETAKVMV